MQLYKIDIKPIQLIFSIIQGHLVQNNQELVDVRAHKDYDMIVTWISVHLRAQFLLNLSNDLHMDHNNART